MFRDKFTCINFNYPVIAYFNFEVSVFKVIAGTIMALVLLYDFYGYKLVTILTLCIFVKIICL